MIKREMISKYPFLYDIESLIQNNNSLQGIDMHEYEKNAFKRIMDAAEGAVFEYAETMNLTNNTMREICTFALIKTILRTANANTMIEKFALKEAEKTKALINLDFHRSKDEIQNIIGMITDIKITFKDNAVEITVPAFLHKTAKLENSKLDLANMKIKSGIVTINNADLPLLLHNDIVNAIKDSIYSAPVSSNNSHIRKIIQMETKLLPCQKTGVKRNLAPCMINAIKESIQNRKLPDNGDNLISYLLKDGESYYQIVKKLGNVLDTRQLIQKIKVIDGFDGNDPKPCASCNELKMFGMCRKTVDCAGVTNPTQFIKGGL